MLSLHHTFAHLPLVLFHARVITIAVVSQSFTIGVWIRHVSDLGAIDRICSLFAVCLQIVMIYRISLSSVTFLLIIADNRIFVQRIVICWLGLCLIALWIDVAIWITSHGQQIRETFAVSGNPLLILFERQLACLELLGENVGDEGPADLFLLIGVGSSLLALSPRNTIPVTILACALILNLTHLQEQKKSD